MTISESRCGISAVVHRYPIIASALLASTIVLALACRGNVTPLQGRSTFAKAYEDVLLKIWYMHWQRGGSPLVPYRHDGPVVMVFLGDGVLRLTSGATQNRRERDVAYFDSGGVANGGELLTDKPLRALVVELKNVPPGRPLPAIGLPPSFPRPNATKILENARVIVWDTSYRPDQPLPFHVHEKNGVQIWLTRAVVNRAYRNQAPQLLTRPAGVYEILRAGVVDSEQVVDIPAHLVAVELK